MFITKMTEFLRVGDCVLVRGTDKGYIECLNKYNYVTVLFIVGRNIEIVPHNQCCQVPLWRALDRAMVICAISTVLLINKLCS